jgi:hypothetical protein
VPPEFAGSRVRPKRTACRFATPLGIVAISGPGNDTIGDAAFFTLDLGGDDRYSGRLGVPVFPYRPIGIVVDLGGHDIYEGARTGFRGCGLFAWTSDLAK